MEYDYAIEQGIPVLVFAIDDNVKLASDKTEADEDKKDNLKKFRTKAMTNRLASIYHLKNFLQIRCDTSISCSVSFIIIIIIPVRGMQWGNCSGLRKRWLE